MPRPAFRRGPCRPRSTGDRSVPHRMRLGKDRSVPTRVQVPVRVDERLAPLGVNALSRVLRRPMQAEPSVARLGDRRSWFGLLRPLSEALPPSPDRPPRSGTECRVDRSSGPRMTTPGARLLVSASGEVEHGPYQDAAKNSSLGVRGASRLATRHGAGARTAPWPQPPAQSLERSSASRFAATDSRRRCCPSASRCRCSARTRSHPSPTRPSRSSSCWVSAASRSST